MSKYKISVSFSYNDIDNNPLTHGKSYIINAETESDATTQMISFLSEKTVPHPIKVNGNTYSIELNKGTIILVEEII